jgi:O-antigen biosynthesis protein
VIGRHRAYPEHGPFVARDLNAMFDRLADFGPLYFLEQGLPSFIYPAGLHWQMTLQFYSDNNSAMARSVWKVIPYPEIDWGEDQVRAWEMLRAGFHKAYIDDACVFHSHRCTPEERYNVSVMVEGRSHGAAWQERSSGTRTSPHLFAPPKKSRKENRSCSQ